MKYFAKWLPVEGKIKKGDEGKHIVTGNIFISEEEHSAGIKMKLFVCSRDVQVGDKIKINGYENLVSVDKIVSDGFEYHVKGTDIYDSDGYWVHIIKKDRIPPKVIAEISTQATWVKEGNEFEFEDLQFAIYPPEHEKVHELATAHIKCPTCETFH